MAEGKGHSDALDPFRKKILQMNRVQILENLISDNELYNHLISKDVYTFIQIKEIWEVCPSEYKRNSMLLDLLHRSSVGQYEAFKELLVECKQEHVACLMEGSLQTGASLFTKSSISREEFTELSKNITSLRQDMDTIMPFMNSLMAKEKGKDETRSRIRPRAERLTQQICSIDERFQDVTRPSENRISQEVEQLTKDVSHLFSEMADIKKVLKDLQLSTVTQDTETLYPSRITQGTDTSHPSTETQDAESDPDKAQLYEHEIKSQNSIESNNEEDTKDYVKLTFEKKDLTRQPYQKHSRGRSMQLTKLNFEQQTYAHEVWKKRRRHRSNSVDGGRRKSLVMKAPKEGSTSVEIDIKIVLEPKKDKLYGFYIQGGEDYGCPVYIQKIAEGGPAERCGLQLRDEIITINGQSVTTYKKALTTLSNAVNDKQIELSVRRSISDNSEER